MTAPVRTALLLGTALVGLTVPGEAKAQAFDGTPIVVGGSAGFDRSQAGQDLIFVRSPSAVINWARENGAAGGDPWLFLPAGNTATFEGPQGFAVLNRLLPRQNETVRMDGNVLGRLAGANTPTANGIVAFYTPNGLLIGGSAVFDVGSLILTTLDPVFALDGVFIQPGGAINFQPNPEFPNASVTTLAGSQINALQDGSFVIFAAPGIAHGGSVRVNGSAAYVAAGGAVVTHNAGLFDIQVTLGTSVATPLVHTGTTGGPASTGAGDAHTIVMRAVSDDQAITALIGGQVGYDAPLSAAIENGAIVISAQVRNSAPNQPQRATLAINGGNFTSDVRAESSHDATAQGSIAFAQDLTLAGARNVRLTAGAGQAITVGGNLLVTSESAVANHPGIDRTGGDVRVSATGGGTIQITGNATVRADGIGRFDPRIQRIGNGTGGTAEVAADGGTIRIGGALTVSAEGATELLTGIIPLGGGIARGGTARLAALNGGLVTVDGAMRTSANGTAARTAGADPVAPTGTGGTATVETGTNGRIGVTGAGLVTATGIGGAVTGVGGTSGIGAGGTARLSANAGQIDLAGTLALDTRGTGGAATTGGGGQGGTSDLLAGTGGTVTIGGAATIAASADGGAGTGGAGGAAQAGAARIEATGGAIRLNGTAQSDILAVGRGGTGTTGGIGRGGATRLAASGAGGTITGPGRLSLQSVGQGGLGVTAGGAGIGGTAQTAANAPIQLGNLAADVGGVGAPGTAVGAVGGNGQGGAITVTVGAAGTLTATNAAGSNRLDAVGAGGGGAGPNTHAGGTVNVNVAAGGRLALAGQTQLGAGVVAGTGAVNATGNAGSITIQNDGATSFDTLTAAASADQASGQGTGGTITIGGTGTTSYQQAILNAFGRGANPTSGGIRIANMTGTPGASNLTVATDGPLNAINISAGQDISLTANNGPLTATNVDAQRALTLATTVGALTATSIRGGVSSTLTTTTGALTATGVAGGATTLATAGGALSASNVNVTGAAALSSGAGNLTANNVVAGTNTSAATTSGTLAATGVRAGQVLTLTTTTGALNATTVAGGTNAVLTTGTGTLTANGVTGGAATLTTGGGALNASNLNVAGAAALSSGTGNLTATNLIAGTTATLGTTSGTLTATGITAPTIALTSGSGAIAATNLTGQTIAATGTTGAVGVTGATAAQSLALATGGTVTLAGAVASPRITVDSSDIAIAAGANVGGANAQVTLIVRPTGTQTVLGGTAQGPGYTLDAAEANRIQAANLTLFVPVGGQAANRPADLVVRDVTLDGGRVTALRLQTPGIVQVDGALLVANAGVANSVTIDGAGPAQRVSFVTPGSVRLRDAAGAPAGTLIVDARDIWIADAARIGQLQANRNFAGRDVALLTPSAAFAPRGFLEGRNVVLRPAESLFVQNSGTLRAFAGITVTDTLSIQGGSAAGPADVTAFGRRTVAGGDVAGTLFFFQVNFGGQFTNGSEFNTCIINPRLCPGGGGGALPGEDIDGGIDGGDGGNEGRPGRLPPLFTGDDLISEAALSEPLIEEPVTSGGDSSAWTENDDEEEEEDAPIVPAPPPAPGERR